MLKSNCTAELGQFKRQRNILDITSYQKKKMIGQKWNFEGKDLQLCTLRDMLRSIFERTYSIRTNK